MWGFTTHLRRTNGRGKACRLAETKSVGVSSPELETLETLEKNGELSVYRSPSASLSLSMVAAKGLTQTLGQTGPGLASAAIWTGRNKPRIINNNLE